MELMVGRRVPTAVGRQATSAVEYILQDWRPTQKHHTSKQWKLCTCFYIDHDSQTLVAQNFRHTSQADEEKVADFIHHI